MNSAVNSTVPLLVGLMSVAGVAILVRVATHHSKAPLPVDISQESCPNAIQDFRDSISWYRGENRLIFRAKKACGTKLGDSYELSDVNVEVRSANRLIAQAHSDTGAYYLAKHEVLFGKTDHGNAQACLPDFEVMTIDLVSGEMRAPGYRTLLNTSEAVACKPERHRRN